MKTNQLVLFFVVVLAISCNKMSLEDEKLTDSEIENSDSEFGKNLRNTFVPDDPPPYLQITPCDKKFKLGVHPYYPPPPSGFSVWITIYQDPNNILFDGYADLGGYTPVIPGLTPCTSYSIEILGSSQIITVHSDGCNGIWLC